MMGIAGMAAKASGRVLAALALPAILGSLAAAVPAVASATQEGAIASVPRRQASAYAPPVSGEDRRPSVSIRFRDDAVVDGPSIRLGEIARVMAGEERLVARLETLEVANAAGFGLTRLVDTDMLFVRHLQPLAARYNIDADRKTVRVTTRSAVLPSDSLARVVDAFLQSQPRRAEETWKWELVRAPGEIKIPAAPHSLEISFAGMRRKGKVELNLAIRAESRILRTLPLVVNLRVEEPVLVARRAIVRDEPLSGENVALERRETTYMNELALTDPLRLMGRTARAGIQPGKIITPRLVAMAPAVRRGQEAKLVYRNGDVNITTGAVCRQDGVPGQIITAKSLATQRLVRVRVTESGLLEPVPGG